MFHVNEANKGQGVITAKDGKMILHVTLAGKSILNLYVGKAENAKNDKENWLNPTVDTVTFDDGMTETAFGFDIPIEKIDTEFDLALIGKKGIWYDHKVIVTK